MNTSTKTILWTKPISLPRLLREPFEDWNQPGLYAWIHPNFDRILAAKTINGRKVHLLNRSGKPDVCYIGRSLSSVRNRLREHYVLSLGARYCIPEAYPDGTEFVPNQYHQSEFLKLFENKEKWQELVQKARHHADQYRVTAAFPPKDERWTKDDLKWMEAQLIYDWQPPENTTGLKSNPRMIDTFKLGPFPSAIR